MTFARPLLVAAAAAALVSHSLAQTPPTGPAALPIPSELRPLAGVIHRHYQQLLTEPRSNESDSQPEQQPGDPFGLPLVLPALIEALDRAIPAAGLSQGRLLIARQQAAQALGLLQQGADGATLGFMTRALQAMASAQGALDPVMDLSSGIDPGVAALLLPAVQSAREAARRGSSRMMEQARLGGVRALQLEPARQAMRSADALSRAGRHGEAGLQHAQAFDLAASTVVFDVARFEQNLRSVFNTQSVGWSYAIAVGGQLAASGATGLARTAADPLVTLQSASRPMHVASVSKTLSAITLMRLLSDRGIPVDSAIGPYLPVNWPRGAGVDSITFRQVLTHRSGFGQTEPSGNDQPSVKAMVGTQVSFTGEFKYANANYALVRELVSQLTGQDSSTLPLWINSAAYASAMYLTRSAWQFGLAGVPFSCSPAANRPTKQYDFPDSGNPGYLDGPSGLVCGGYGVHISALDLARVMANLRYTVQLVPAQTFQQMKAGYLGFMNPLRYDFAQGLFGVYYTHGGDWDHTGSGGLDACVMMFPIHVEAAVLINSSRNASGTGYSNGGYQCSVVKWAFENAWAAK